MPDLPEKSNPYDWAESTPILRIEREDHGSLRAAKRRLGWERERLDPSRVRIRCEADGFAAVSGCWREAHKPVDFAGETYHLCPRHADEAEAAMFALEAEDAVLPHTEVRQSLTEAPRAQRSRVAAWEQEMKQQRKDARYAQRVAAGFPGADTGKSKLARTTEYRRIEKRRERARKAGNDPDTMGGNYQYPRRETRRGQEVLAKLERDLSRSMAALGRK